MISILMSCYNSNFNYLNEQLASIWYQTEQDFEVLIYNDGTDGLLEYLKEIRALNEFWKLKYFEEGHKGYTKAYDFLLKKAKGEYVCFCDHDDIWEPDKLEIEKKYLDEHPEVDCVFGWLRWFGEKNKLESFSISDEQISKDLYFYQPIKQPTTMFRRKRFGSFDAPFDAAADFWFWAKHKDRHYHLIEKVLVNYRRHAEEATKDKKSFRLNSAKVIQTNILKRFNEKLPLDICSTLDKYSKNYSDTFKRFIESLL